MVLAGGGRIVRRPSSASRPRRRGSRHRLHPRGPGVDHEGHPLSEGLGLLHQAQSLVLRGVPRPFRARRGDQPGLGCSRAARPGAPGRSGGSALSSSRRRVDADVRPSRALRPHRPAHVGNAPADHRRAEHCRDRVRRRVGRRECPGPCRGDAVQGPHRAGHARLQAPPGGARRIHGGYSGPRDGPGPQPRADPRPGSRSWTSYWGTACSARTWW